MLDQPVNAKNGRFNRGFCMKMKNFGKNTTKLREQNEGCQRKISGMLCWSPK
jgi:hypothetical protein